MLNYLSMIFTCQLAGEVLVRSLAVPVPGPVLGMVFLFFFLVWRGHVPENLGTVASSLLNHLSLLFVPAGVGVMLHLNLLKADGIVLGTALVVSTVATIAVTALTMTWIGRLKNSTTASTGEDR